MPRPRFDKLDPERRREVLEAAAREFAAHGYHEASLNRVQAELGLSKGGFYYWFDDKEDLFLATLVDRAAPFDALVAGFLTEVADAAAFWARVEELVRTGMAVVGEDPVALGLFQAAMALSPQSSPRLAAWWAEGLQATRAVLEAGQAAGAVRTDLDLDLLASVVFSMGEALDRWLVGRGAEAVQTEAQAEATVALYVGLLRRVSAP
ncbi:MAG: TetR/AcrR family transcriptional regulator [Alphaproteobacteria bacterium]|nr:TetR/AcrR family transcriptional regulator [Alphaproteobacteria bacterium]